MSVLNAKDSNAQEGGPSFSLSHRLLRLFWAIAWGLLASWTPVPLHGWRRFIARCFGANIHRSAKIYPSVTIWYPPNLTMKEYSTLAPKVNCYCMAPITLGEYAIVSQGAYLCAGTHDIDDPSFQLQIRPILIGKFAWVAAEAFVGPGANLGDGAVLGARAVTFKSLEAMSVYAGNPAKFIRLRKAEGILK